MPTQPSPHNPPPTKQGQAETGVVARARRAAGAARGTAAARVGQNLPAPQVEGDGFGVLEAAAVVLRRRGGRGRRRSHRRRRGTGTRSRGGAADCKANAAAALARQAGEGGVERPLLVREGLLVRLVARLPEALLLVQRVLGLELLRHWRVGVSRGLAQESAARLVLMLHGLGGGGGSSSAAAGLVCAVDRRDQAEPGHVVALVGAAEEPGYARVAAGALRLHFAELGARFVGEVVG